MAANSHSPAPRSHVSSTGTNGVSGSPRKSIARVVEEGRDNLYKATTYKNFNRLDMAYEEFRKALVTAVDVVPAHPDFVSLQRDHPRVYVSHRDLLRDVKLEIAFYTEVKKRLDAEKDQKQRPQTPSTELQMPRTRPQQKPAVSPKPPALQGHRISRKSPETLISRFNNLRTPPAAGNGAVQDPRIKTHLIPFPPDTQGAVATANGKQKPWGPREMPRLALKPAFEDGGDSPLTKPSAMYNPPRAGSITAMDLPSSSPRGMFSRNGSFASLPQPVSNPLQENDRRSSSSETITVPELRRYIEQMKARVLWIDVRSREHFDAGHIQSPSTICITPLTLKQDMSAAQVADSMVVDSTPLDEDRFKRRTEFDMIVLYDNGSRTIPKHGAPEDENVALRYMYEALRLYDDNNPVPVKLLEGGLNAWSNSGPDRTGQSPDDAAASKLVYLPDKEIQKWQDLLDEEENGENAFSMVKSTDDFLRRYPDVNSMQQSMTSAQVPPDSTVAADLADLNKMFPTIPSRPAPAVHRPSYTGLADNIPDPTQAANLSARAARQQPRPLIVSVKPANLYNEGQTCYADTALQLLVASSGLSEYLASGRWMDVEVFEEKSGTRKRHPQILTRILAGLFQHLMSGAVEWGVKATMLRKYMGDLGKHSCELPDFGNVNAQQDISEYLGLLVEYLDNETNPMRLEQDHQLSAEERSVDMPPFHYAACWYRQFRRSHNSVVDSFMRYTTTEHKTCRKCGHIDSEVGTCATEPNHIFSVAWPPGRTNDVLTLEDMIKHALKSDATPKCEKCGMNKTIEKRFSSLPQYLFISLTRYHFVDGQQVKFDTLVDLPMADDLDMTPFMWPKPDEALLPNGKPVPPIPPQMEGPFRYQLYGVAMHSGTNAYSGHYTAYVRQQGPGASWRNWWFLNDSYSGPAQDFTLRGISRLEHVRYMSGGNNDMTMLCYKRGLRSSKSDSKLA